MDINNYIISNIRNENKSIQNYIITNYSQDLKESIAKIYSLDKQASLESVYKFLDSWLRLQIKFSKEILDRIPFAHDIKRAGDYHNQQRSTVIVQSKDDELFIYKPVSPAFLILMNEIYSLLKADFDFKELKIINNWNNGYLAEYLQNEQAFLDAKKYSYHYGGLSLIAYILKITDLHKENIITFNSVPIIIDAETLFYPSIEGLKPFSFQSTLLFKSKFNNRSPLQDINNFDRQAFLRGIKTCEWLFLHKKNEINECIEKYRDQSKTRIIFKPTKYYIQLINNSLHPAFLLKEEVRIQYIRDSLKGSHKITKSIIGYELESIKQLDVPYFVADSEGRIQALNGQRINILSTPYSFADSLSVIKAMSTEISTQISSSR